MKFKEDGSRKVYNIDLDGTLTNGEPYWNQEPTPNENAIGRTQQLYAQGNVIIIHTARQWWDACETIGWLFTHQVPFHGIFMAKGGSDCYIDDKSQKEFPQDIQKSTEENKSG